jgi:hypothetical protein
VSVFWAPYLISKEKYCNICVRDYSCFFLNIITTLYCTHNFFKKNISPSMLQSCLHIKYFLCNKCLQTNAKVYLWIENSRRKLARHVSTPMPKSNCGFNFKFHSQDSKKR